MSKKNVTPIEYIEINKGKVTMPLYGITMDALRECQNSTEVVNKVVNSKVINETEKEKISVLFKTIEDCDNVTSLYTDVVGKNTLAITLQSDESFIMTAGEIVGGIIGEKRSFVAIKRDDGKIFKMPISRTFLLVL